MAVEIRIRLRPQLDNGFHPTSFSDLLQHQVSFPGLDQSYLHTLVKVVVERDGAWAELTIRSEPMHRVQLGAALRPSFGPPPARIKALDVDGNELHVGHHPSPLRVGEQVAIGDQHYQVGAVDWPHRDPVTGACVGEIDWQYVILQPIPNPVPEPAPFAALGGVPRT